MITTINTHILDIKIIFVLLLNTYSYQQIIQIYILTNEWNLQMLIN